MKNTKGLSAVVTTLIIILLVLVAVGLLWVVAQGLFETTEEQIDMTKKCIGITLEIESATAVGSVTVRMVGGTTPVGLEATFYNADGTIPNGKIQEETDLSLMNTLTVGTAISGATKVVVAAYFEDEGVEHYCSQVAEFEI